MSTTSVDSTGRGRGSRPEHPFYWHAFFLAMTMSFTEINTVMPALVLAAGGGVVAVGALTAVMIGLPLISQLLFAGFLTTRPLKRPYLLLGIHLRVAALAGAACGIAALGTDPRVIAVVFFAMTIFAMSGAFAGVSYADLVGTLVPSRRRRSFFVRRQVLTTLGLFTSALVVRFLLGSAAFPDGYVLLFALAAGVLFVAAWGFWLLDEPRSTTTDRPRSSVLRALRQAPRMLASDSNLLALVAVANLAAFGFTSIPLLTALADARYDLTATAVGTFVLVQIAGMLVSSPVWSRIIGIGGYRLVLGFELVLLATVFPLALVLSATAPLTFYGGVFLLTGAVMSAHKIGLEGALVQISPDGERALYAGLFGAANLGAAVLPLLAGAAVVVLGFTPVLVAAAGVALLALVPLQRLSCGHWYREV